MISYKKILNIFMIIIMMIVKVKEFYLKIAIKVIEW